MGRTWTVGSTGCDYTTITNGESGASVGDVLILMPETFTENPTLNPGISLFSYGGSRIIGKCSVSASGYVECRNIQFETNSDYCISITGSNNSSFYLYNCGITASDHDAMQLSSTGNISSITGIGCQLNISNSSYTYFSMTNGNNLHFMSSFFNNSSSSVVASNCSAGQLLIEYSTVFGSMSTTGTGSYGAFSCNIDTSGIPTTPIFITGTGSNVISNCYVGSGVAVPFYVSTGHVLGIGQCTLNTSNINVAGGGILSIIREI